MIAQGKLVGAEQVAQRLCEASRTWPVTGSLQSKKAKGGIICIPEGGALRGHKESDIRKQIQDYLRWNGWFVYYNLAGLGSYPGLSDLVAVRGGRVVHISKDTQGRAER